MDVLETAFYPKAIAIVGASDGNFSAGSYFMSYILDYGYAGPVYPVNPTKQVVHGLKAYPDLSSIPGQVDYVICCLPAPKILDLLAECPAKGVKVVHLFTARMSETGQQKGKDLEAEILQQARRMNVRLIGPNCMGVYHPRQGIGFGYDMSKEPGTVGAVFQSGGASALLVRYGELQGLRFSKVISYGNALDLDESDFLRYLAHDDETEVIAAYFEGIKDGRRFFDALADAAHAKPVIAIKGGRSIAGTKSVASHTAAIAGSNIIWDTVFRSTGAIQARDMNELVDFVAAFSFLPPIKGDRVGIVGGGGGKSVMSADACEEAGFTVPPLPPEIERELETRAPELRGWLGNPIDSSIMGGTAMNPGELPRMLAQSPHFDFILANLTEENPLPREMWGVIIKSETEELIKVAEEQLKPVVAVVSAGKVTSDQSGNERWKLLAEQRARLIAAHIPTYSTVAEAATAVRQCINYWQTKAEA